MKSRKSDKTKKNIEAEQIVERFGLPKDLFLGMPLLSMEGNRTLHIGNHRGIVKYSSSTIVIAAHAYGIQVEGRNLLIPQFSGDMVEITGYIESVTFLL
ncbi:MAG: YabP/YqfC family sporulation protein [Lachnospiraceae bacterium]|nr:YabP/YqfC family sporulation protein [Lachnospiraceae bacterium]